MTESSTDDNKAAFVDGLEVLPTFDTETCTVYGR